MSKSDTGKHVRLIRDITYSHEDTLGEYRLVKVGKKGQLARVVGYNVERGLHLLRIHHTFHAKEGRDFESCQKNQSNLEHS